MDKQSPININVSTDIRKNQEEALSIHWQDFDGSIEDTGYLIRVYGDGGYVSFKNHKFEFVEFHFHMPSEHHIDQKFSPMEIHFVHYNKDLDRYVVLGVFVQEGVDMHTELQKVINHLPHRGTDIKFKVNPLALFPLEVESFYYEGSLTVVPCLEIVAWHVFHKPIYVQEDQLKALSKIHNQNARPLQPLNNRLIEKIKIVKQ